MKHGWHIPESRAGEIAVGIAILAILSFYAAMFFKYHDILERWEVWHLSFISLAWLLGCATAFRLIVGVRSMER